jgi:hypothetical protein
MKIDRHLWIAFMLFGGLAQAQHLDSLRYQLVGLAMDKYFESKTLGYFYDTIQVYLPAPKIDEDTFYHFNPVTYEKIAYTPEMYQTQYYPKAKKEYDIEKALWQLRRTIQQKVILIGAAPAQYRDYLRPERIIQAPEYQNLLVQLRQIDTVYWDVKRIRTNLSYRLDGYSEKASRFYKYVAGGYVWISEVVFDKSVTHAMLLMGAHYADTIGRTGSGGFLLFKKVNHQWIIDKSYGIWEE